MQLVHHDHIFYDLRLTELLTTFLENQYKQACNTSYFKLTPIQQV